MTSLVSVVVPARNAGEFVEQAVRSVLDQTHADLECIVIDDGSSDGTGQVADLISDVRVRVVHQPNRGVAEARNRGIAEARGDLIGFLDADDVWLPDKLERQLALFESDRRLAAVLSGFAVVDRALGTRVVFRPRQDELDMRSWLAGSGSGFLISSTGLVPRSVIDEVGGFDPRFSTSADLDFALRLAERRRIAAIDDVLVLYRTHPGQMHRDLTAYERDASSVIERYAEGDARRRALANLHVRLAAHRMLRREWHAFAGHVRQALSADPRGALLLPPTLLRERVRRRSETRRYRQRW